MQLIKEKTRFTGRDIKLKISLDSTNNLNGLQQAINDYIERETGLSINPVTDGETFKYKTTTLRSITPYFYNGVGLDDNLEYAGFTADEIANKDDVVTNSFYILQIYDTIVGENQTLLHNSYYNGYDIEFVSTTILLKEEEEVSNFYIPEWYIDENTNLTGEINFVVKLLFFNAKTGKLQIFYNRTKASDTTEDKIYYDGTLFLVDKTYTLETNAMQFNEFENVEYADKINESLDTFDNEAPVFPEGKQFNNDGTYTEVTT